MLEISENTGVTDLLMDPRDPDVLIAASYQRRRHVWTLIDGGPESALYKSTDGGESWDELTEGLPSGDVGRIGLAQAPARPDVVYAIIEASNDAGGLYRSVDAGVNWEKRSDYVSGSPQYYQELVVDPHDSDSVYSLDYHKGTKRLVSGSYNGEVRIFDVDTGKLVSFFVAAPGCNSSTAERKLAF